jgi:hypothetical protein
MTCNPPIAYTAGRQVQALGSYPVLSRGVCPSQPPVPSRLLVTSTTEAAPVRSPPLSRTPPFSHPISSVAKPVVFFSPSRSVRLLLIIGAAQERKGVRSTKPSSRGMSQVTSPWVPAAASPQCHPWPSRHSLFLLTGRGHLRSTVLLWLSRPPALRFPRRPQEKSGCWQAVACSTSGVWSSCAPGMPGCLPKKSPPPIYIIRPGHEASSLVFSSPRIVPLVLCLSFNANDPFARSRGTKPPEYPRRSQPLNLAKHLILRGMSPVFFGLRFELMHGCHRTMCASVSPGCQDDYARR